MQGEGKIRYIGISNVSLAELEQYARDQGITHVVAGPLVRSSYHADGQAQLVRSLRAAKGLAPVSGA